MWFDNAAQVMGGQKWHGRWRTLCWLNIGQAVALYACNYIHRLHKEKKHLESSIGEQVKNKLNVFENWFASLIDGFMTSSLPKNEGETIPLIISDLIDPLHHI